MPWCLTRYPGLSSMVERRLSSGLMKKLRLMRRFASSYACLNGKSSILGCRKPVNKCLKAVENPTKIVDKRPMVYVNNFVHPALLTLRSRFSAVFKPVYEQFSPGFLHQFTENLLTLQLSTGMSKKSAYR